MKEYIMKQKVILKDNIPEELKELRHWVAWIWGKADENDNCPKIPINPKTRNPASSKDLKTWGTFTDAYRCFIKNKLSGVGFVFSKKAPYMGIDMDNCRSTSRTLIPRPIL